MRFFRRARVTALVVVSALTASGLGLMPAGAASPPGTVFAWGENAEGQLGTNDNTNRVVPTAVVGPLSNAIDVSASPGIFGSVENHSMALLSNGTIRTWGSDSQGQLGDGAPVGGSSNVPVPVSGIGGPFQPNATAVAAGGLHSLAVLDNQQVRSWGDDAFQQLGNGPGGDANAPVTVFVDPPGPPPPTPLDSVKAIAGGGAHSLALLISGEIFAWGLDNCGQLGNGGAPPACPTAGVVSPFAVPVDTAPFGAPPIPAKAIAAGTGHSLAVLSDGRVFAWGADGNGQLGNGPSAMFQASPGLVDPTNLAPPPITTAVAVAAGEIHSLALLANGSIKAWGDNSFGQLGNGIAGQADLPTDVVLPAGAKAVAIAAAGTHSLALLDDGRVMAWGSDADGQLGSSATAFGSSLPVFVDNLTGVGAIAAGGDSHSLAIQAQAVADLSIAKSVSNANPLIGQQVTYTITVTNPVGADVVPAGGFTVTDVLPPTMVLDTALPAACPPPPLVGQNGPITCSNTAPLAPGTSTTFVIVARAHTAGPATQTAEVETSPLVFDPNDDNNEASIAVNVFESAADLAISKVASDSDLVVGDPVAFTVTVTNQSAATASNIKVVDTLPSSLGFALPFAPAPFTCTSLPVGGSGTITCTLPSLAGGASQSFTINATAKTPGVADNSAVVSHNPPPGEDPDPDLNDNTAHAFVNITAPAIPEVDLSVDKDASGFNQVVGVPFTYTVTVSNAIGVDQANNVRVTDTLPPNVVFLGLGALPPGVTCPDTPTPGTNGTIRCIVAAIPPGASGSVTATVRADAPGLVTNTATATTPGANEVFAGDNTGSASVNVSNPQVDLAIVKTASDFNLAVGEDFTFSATVTNNGPATATNVLVRDTLPAGITFQGQVGALPAGTSCNFPAVGASGTITCNVAAIPASASGTVTILVRAEVPGTHTNTATVTAGPGFTETTTANNSSSASINVAEPASPANTFVDLALTKTASSYKVKKGRKFDFEITVRNLGPDTAPVQVSDRLSDKVTFRYIDFGDGPVGDCDTPDWGTSGTLSCTFPPLAPGEVIEFEVKVKAKSKGTATNHATASPIAPAGDPNLNNNDAQANVKIR